MNEDEIIKQFRDLQSEIREDKIKLELDPTISRFIDQLFDQDGWKCYFHIISNCLDKDSLIYYSKSTLPNERLLELLSRSFAKGAGYFADIISKYLRVSADSSNADFRLELFQNFVDEGALVQLAEILEYCPMCDKLRIVESENSKDECPECSGKLFQIVQASLPETVRLSIANGQLLEVFVKKCLSKAGFRVISKPIGDDGIEVSTSIPYRVFATDVEVDVGAVRNSSLVLLECKTGKFVPNDMSQKLTQYKLLIDTLKRRMNGLPDIHIRFVVLGEVDPHVEAKVYESAYSQDLNLKSLEVINREQILDLTGYLSTLRSKL